MLERAGPLVRLATLADLAYIVELAKRETDTIGFIPRAGYVQCIQDRRVLLVEENGQEAGFCYWTQGELAHVIQIAVQDDARRLRLGQALIAEVDRQACAGISLRCWGTLPANDFWRALGFTRLGTDYTPNARGRPVNRYLRLKR